MPLSKSACLDVMTVDPNATVASKTFTNSIDKRKGFKFSKKVKYSDANNSCKYLNKYKFYFAGKNKHMGVN